MKLKEILNEIIAQKSKPLTKYKLFELFDFENKQIPKITRFSDMAYNFEVEIDGGMVDVYVDFVKTEPDRLILIPVFKSVTDIYNVAYALGDEMETNQYAKTDLKTIGFIMYAITEVVAKFVKDKSPEMLTFFATSKDFTDRGEQQKLNMYKTIADKYKPHGYIVGNIRSADGQSGFYLADKS